MNITISFLLDRTSNGKLHLVPAIGKIPLADALLIEDPSETQEDEGKQVEFFKSPKIFISRSEINLFVSRLKISKGFVYIFHVNYSSTAG